MTTIKDKLVGQTAATPHEVMETNFNNIKMSYDEHVEFYRKVRERKATLKKLEQEMIDKQEQEDLDLIKAGQEDNNEFKKSETTEE